MISPQSKYALGPDCSVSGGGAAVLEIEELCNLNTNGSSNNNNDKKNLGGDVVRMNIGGCRDICSMGPNIYINGVTFTKVNSPSACRQALKQTGISKPPERDCDDNSSSSARILKRREDGRRWRINREKAAKQRRLQVRARNDS
eukprot:CAMPEP_0194191034 /NCGR_PEP_ID=MMETSP0154-20130528/65257_1 /TAXON_ID=1049557 /ORGANISM="Thalassiothrix antarctica, Strain L6-D1" /LENGTH=143 /DNA_ID=CAMNT_0038913381 /DNA_START=286 /DNA_END=712 /DNA_ORIENTATION=+